MRIRSSVTAICSGLALFAAIEALLGLLAQWSWPAYAAAVPERAYTVPMLLVRLTAGAAGTICAGAFATWVGQGQSRNALAVGIAMLALSLIWHIAIWPQYPLWYHLAWFACLIPAAWLGGRFCRA